MNGALRTASAERRTNGTGSSGEKGLRAPTSTPTAQVIAEKSDRRTDSEVVEHSRNGQDEDDARERDRGYGQHALDESARGQTPSAEGCSDDEKRRRS